jgi:hypothetical protein
MSRLLSAGLIALCLGVFATIAACTGQNPTPVPPNIGTATAASLAATTTPEVVPTPEPGQVTVTGRLVDTNTHQPFTNMIVRLAKIIHIDPNDDGTWLIDDATSPGDYTDDQGTFIIPNVPVQDYVLVVGDFHTRYAIVTDTPDNALVVTTTADQIVDVQQVDVVLP